MTQDMDAPAGEPLRDALAELVALKDLEQGLDYWADVKRINAAWEAAREALAAAAPAGEPPPMKTWQHDETGRICLLERSPGPRWAEVPQAVYVDAPAGEPAPIDMVLHCQGEDQ